VTALACFFAFGALASTLAGALLLAPGGPLDTVWQLNPRGHEGFLRMGGWAPVLLGAVCLACVAAGYGFFTAQRWGYRLGTAILVINLTSDILNAALGTDRRAAFGVPVVGLLLWYVSTTRVRTYFSAGAQ
jgi:hypothetical protein